MNRLLLYLLLILGLMIPVARAGDPRLPDREGVGIAPLREYFDVRHKESIPVERLLEEIPPSKSGAKLARILIWGSKSFWHPNGEIQLGWTLNLRQNPDGKYYFSDLSNPLVRNRQPIKDIPKNATVEYYYFEPPHFSLR